MARTFPAAFDSECAECDGAIFEGDEIGKYLGSWVHEECIGPDDDNGFKMWWD